jgi:RNA ligase
MKFNIDRKKYIDSGLVDEKEHPSLPLFLYNYTQECQFGKHWDETTLMCRGLVVEKGTNEVIAKPFNKFFNYEEHLVNGDSLPDETPIVYPKFDGSLGIMFFYGGKWYISTRGSFTSDQAIWAMTFINQPDIYQWTEKLDKSKTHLFEIIYPENRIVVSYGYRKELVHLASVDNQTGKTEKPDSYFPMASEIPFTSYEQLKGLNLQNEEGFVLWFPNSDFRVKIKFEDYVKLHKIMTGLSQIGIWEMLRDSKNPFAQDIPDEMLAWLSGIVDDLKEKFETIRNTAEETFTEAIKFPIRKDQALVISKSKYPGIAFSMLDNKNYSDAIWKMIRPKGSYTFKRDIDS